MPIKDDLILRMLDQIAEVVARVTLGRGGGDVVEAERTLAQAYQHLTGSSRQLVARLSSDQLLAILGAPTGFNRERGYVLGRLLEADAAMRDGAGEAAAAETARLQALDLFLAARAADLQEEDLDARIEAQVAALNGVLLPPSSHWRLFDDRVATARFDQAEDLLFDGVERFGAGGEALRRGRAFYRDLEALDDDALAAGGLPRDEVLEGRDALEARAGGGA